MMEKMLKNKGKYDIIIVGAGPGGLFTALEASRKNPDKKILLVERGNPIEDRHCPIAEWENHHTAAEVKPTCKHCKLCAIMNGTAGAGAFSDGKVHYYPFTLNDIYVGGNLHKYIGVEVTKQYAYDAHQIYLEFGADPHVEGMDNPAAISEIRNRVEGVPGLLLPIVPVRHIGTEKSRVIFKKIQDELIGAKNVTFVFHTEMKDIIVENNAVKGIICKSSNLDFCGKFYGDAVVLAVGRSGSQEFLELAKKHKINTAPGTVDVGVRIECPRSVWEKECAALYELKILVKTPTYKDDVRTFCMNDGGFVTSEMSNDIVCANGHANKELKSENTNYAILVSMNFEDIEKPMEYMQDIGKVLNRLGHGNILVQRLGDIRKGKRTWEDQLRTNSVVPTLKACEAGDITLGLPGRYVRDIVEAMDLIDKAIPGSAHDDVLLYGPEFKFYGIRPRYADSSHLETNIKGLYAIGDGCGLTHGLIQASAAGVLVGRYLSGK